MSAPLASPRRAPPHPATVYKGRRAQKKGYGDRQRLENGVGRPQEATLPGAGIGAIDIADRLPIPRTYVESTHCIELHFYAHFT